MWCYLLSLLQPLVFWSSKRGSNSPPGRGHSLAFNLHLLSLLLTSRFLSFHGSLMLAQLSLTQAPRAARPSLSSSLLLSVWGCKAVAGKGKQTLCSPGEEGSPDCKGELNKMVCVIFSCYHFAERKNGSRSLTAVYRGCAFTYCYGYKNLSSEQKKLPFKLELATTACFQVLQCKKLTACYVEILNRFLNFLSCKILLSFVLFIYLFFISVWCCYLLNYFIILPQHYKTLTCWCLLDPADKEAHKKGAGENQSLSFWKISWSNFTFLLSQKDTATISLPSLCIVHTTAT